MEKAGTKGDVSVHSIRAEVFLALGLACRTLNFTPECTSLGTLVWGGGKESIDDRKVGRKMGVGKIPKCD